MNELLVDPKWLRESMDSPEIRVVDCSDPDAYWQVFIPGAVKIPDWRLKDPADPNAIVPASRMADLVAQLGVARDTQVVLYDGAGGVQYYGMHACRVWWVLNCYGYDRVAVLDGGWRRWLYETAITYEVRPVIEPVRARPVLRKDCVATVPELARRSHESGVVIWDARSELQFSGRAMKRRGSPGHIPGAVNLDARDLLSNTAYHIFKGREQLRRELSAAGIDQDSEVIAYSDDGTGSAMACFALTMLGYRRVRNLEGGWAEWSATKGLPIEQ